MTPLSKVLRLKADGPSLTTEIPQDWLQGRSTFGGLLAAIAIRGLQTPAQGRTMRSFIMDCIRPTVAGPLEVEVETLRVGRSMLHARATLRQAGETCAILLGTFGNARPSKLHYEAASVADARMPPEQLVRLPFIEGAMPAFSQHFDYRWTSQHGLFSGAAEGKLSGYVRALDADRVDSAVIAALIDSFPSPVLTQLRAPAPSATATWMVNFTHARPAMALTELCRYEATTTSASGGYATVDTKLWDAGGRLLADSRQLVVEFS
jgi:acyl-CoA thioesterase